MCDISNPPRPQQQVAVSEVQVGQASTTGPKREESHGQTHHETCFYSINKP